MQVQRGMLVMAFLAGIAVGALLISFTGGSTRARTRVIEGYSNGANVTGTAFGLAQEPGGDGEGYIIAGARWRDGNGPWHEGEVPTCLEPLTSGQKVRMGVIDVVLANDSPFGTQVVVWLECLD